MGRKISFAIALSNGLVVQLVRIPACHAGGREFESRPDRLHSPKFRNRNGGEFSFRAIPFFKIRHASLETRIVSLAGDSLRWGHALLGTRFAGDTRPQTRSDLKRGGAYLKTHAFKNINLNPSYRAIHKIHILTIEDHSITFFLTRIYKIIRMDMMPICLFESS